MTPQSPNIVKKIETDLIPEITPETLEAGVVALYASCVIENPLKAADEAAVREVYLAMHALSHSSFRAI